jgi:hypothetical protein
MRATGSILLGTEWTFWYDEKPPRGTSEADFEKYMKNLGTFSSIQVKRHGSLCLTPVAPFSLGLSPTTSFRTSQLTASFPCHPNTLALLAFLEQH